MKKKAIEFGQDIPSPTYVRQNIRKMEQRPFDGVAMRLSEQVGSGWIFDIANWEACAEDRSSRQQQELETLNAIAWGEQLQDNFVTLYARSTMDWFNGADWEKVLAQVRFCVQAAKAGRCKGVLWDPEPYGGVNPWIYSKQPNCGDRTFEDYAKIVRQRGAEFMRVLQEGFPGLEFLSLRILSDYQQGSPFSFPIFDIKDGQDRTQQLAGSYYGLHPAFLNGMLEAVAPGVTITDANEDAYYYTSEIEYYRIYKVLRQDAMVLVAPENHGKYRAQVRVGQAASVDYCVGRWAGRLGGFPRALSYQGLELTPEQRAQWFEHNMYYALDTADEYVWVYTERPLDWWTGEGIPPGIEDALRSAKQKQAAKQPLGFTVETMLEQARARAAEGNK